MRNIWRLFAGDVKRLGRNVVTVIIVLGLIAIPSLFSWYNMIACWSVFDNTGNLKVAVANVDEGYESDLVPIKVNIGEQVVSALRANDQLHWVITDEDDAIDGARSGRYYAAVVIPGSFSKDMMTFYSDDVEHAKITYYSNEKKNAIAPKVTDQGADKVSAQVNQVFAKTLSEAALGISSSLLEYADRADVDGRMGDLSAHVTKVADRMQNASSVLSAYSSVLASAQSLVADSGALLKNVNASSGEAASSAAEAKDAAGTLSSAVDGSVSALSSALDRSAASFGGVSESVGAAFDAAGALSGDAAKQLRDAGDGVNAQVGDYRALVSQLETLKDTLPEEDKPLAEGLISRLNSSILLQEQLRDSLYSAADGVEKGSANTQDKREEVEGKAAQAKESLDAAMVDYDENLKPHIAELGSSVSAAGGSLASVGALLDSASSSLAGTADSVSGRLSDARGKIDAASADLVASADKLETLSRKMDEALASGDAQALRDVIGSDPSAFASALSAPVQLDRHAVYPVDNFGSAMSPLYTTLALWIGALLMMVALKVNPSPRTIDELDDPTPRQLFIGRFGIVALLSLLQSTCVCLGNLFFLHVQADNPLLYVLCFWVSGLVFAFIIYTLVVSFANFGKALSVFLLVIQVSAGGGSYPLQLLPEFVQNVSPYLPITHAVNAMRAAMFGVYNGDFWAQIGVLLLFTVPFIVLGLVLRNPLIKVVSKFVEKVESTKVM